MNDEIALRIAVALEQIALELGERPQINIAAPEPLFPADLPPEPVADLPQPFAPIGTGAPKGSCPVHRQPWKLVPGGVSKRTGKHYDAFYACPERDCKERPA